MSTIRLAALAIVFLAALPARAATLSVGPGKAYATPCAAFAAAADGDIIEIAAAGTYDGDVCAIAPHRLTIRGVGGRAHIDAAGKNAGGKAIWIVMGDDTTIEDIELSGATVPDQNGAGIRQEGTNLTVRRCFFHDNENGILAGADPASEIVIESTEFARNGFGDGFSHNLYVGEVKRLVFRFNSSHHARIGHELKTRAHENVIVANRLMNESDGTASYEIDIAQGGDTWIIGNLVQQGPLTDNPVLLSYAAEGAKNPGKNLYVVNNTFVSDRGSGATFVRAPAEAAVVIKNNIFLGEGVVSAPTSELGGNFGTGDPVLVDRAGFDYHLTPGSPCVNAGADPGMGAGMSLVPMFQYRHAAMAEARTIVGGAIDIGAYELGAGGAVDAGVDGAGGSPDGGGGGAGGGTSGAGGGTPADAAAQGGSDGGCGCRIAGAAESADRPWRVVLILLTFARRRRCAQKVTVRDPGCSDTNVERL